MISRVCLFVGWLVRSFVNILAPIISKTVVDRGAVPMAYDESNGHVIENVT